MPHYTTTPCLAVAHGDGVAAQVGQAGKGQRVQRQLAGQAAGAAVLNRDHNAAAVAAGARDTGGLRGCREGARSTAMSRQTEMAACGAWVHAKLTAADSPPALPPSTRLRTCANVPLPWPHCTSMQAPQPLMDSSWTEGLLGLSAAIFQGQVRRCTLAWNGQHGRDRIYPHMQAQGTPRQPLLLACANDHFCSCTHLRC